MAWRFPIFELLMPNTSLMYTGRYVSCISVATEHSICAVARDNIFLFACGSLNGVMRALSLLAPAAENTCGVPRDPAGCATHITRLVARKLRTGRVDPLGRVVAPRVFMELVKERSIVVDSRDTTTRCQISS